MLNNKKKKNLIYFKLLILNFYMRFNLIINQFIKKLFRVILKKDSKLIYVIKMIFLNINDFFLYL